VTGYLIVDAEGTVLRKHADMSAADVKKYSSLIRDLSGRARHVVRDLNPTNDLRCMRLKTSNVEILVAPHAKFTVVVIQRWKPAVDP
jgi:dynein light chain roadblock-type|tara:strand:- start:222 stop:482 length:261 start_codon:yes stop_codon:yes gene_type:complete